MNILVVDDEQHIRESIERLLELEGIESECAEDASSGQKLLLEKTFDAVVLDLKLPGMDGQQLLTWMKDEGIDIPVIMISAHGEIRDAVKALKTGARDYLVKPFDPAELVWKVRDAVEYRKRENLLEVGRRTAGRTAGLIGKSPAIRKIRDQIERIASTPSKVLLTGESGTGKEIAAREIHEHSARSGEPFVAVNIGGLPETLIESELFGYEKGAFTGADSRKQGLFELAGKGTLFLDEIGEMPLPLQVKLLRVLQERKVRRLGGSRDIPVEGRIISATNKNIEEMVENGSFRQDLFYRLNVVRIVLPPLRERKEDIPVLAGFLTERLAGKMGIQEIGLSADALEKLKSYSYPGNVRELENILERALIFRRGREIGSADIDLPGSSEGAAHNGAGGGSGWYTGIQDESEAADAAPVREVPADRGGTDAGGRESAGFAHVTGEKNGGMSIREVERRTIVETLRKWKGNRTRAADELGISRRTIINKIRKYGIEE